MPAIKNTTTAPIIPNMVQILEFDGSGVEGDVEVSVGTTGALFWSTFIVVVGTVA